METSKKYNNTTRKLPAFDAKKCCNQYRWGNDMHLYRSLKNKKGRCSWVKIDQNYSSTTSWNNYIDKLVYTYGVPYNYTRVYSRNYVSNDNSDRKFGTIIDINVKPSIDLEYKKTKIGRQRESDEEYLDEQQKYINLNDLFDWYIQQADFLESVVVDFGVRETDTVMQSINIYNIDNPFVDGYQITFALQSRIPLNEDEISFAIESITSFDSDGNYPITLNDKNKIYKSRALVYNLVESNYKLTTWKYLDKAAKGSLFSNVKTVSVGDINHTLMPTIPILDAKRYRQVLSKKPNMQIVQNSDRKTKYYYPKKKNSDTKSIKLLKKTTKCSKESDKRYSSPTRKAPEYAALNCKNRVIVGKDGNKWKSKKTSKGTYTWVRVPSRKKKQSVESQEMKYFKWVDDATGNKIDWEKELSSSTIREGPLPGIGVSSDLDSIKSVVNVTKNKSKNTNKSRNTDRSKKQLDIDAMLQYLKWADDATGNKVDWEKELSSSTIREGPLPGIGVSSDLDSIKSVVNVTKNKSRNTSRSKEDLPIGLPDKYVDKFTKRLNSNNIGNWNLIIQIPLNIFISKKKDFDKLDYLSSIQESYTSAAELFIKFINSLENISKLKISNNSYIKLSNYTAYQLSDKIKDGYQLNLEISLRSKPTQLDIQSISEKVCIYLDRVKNIIVKDNKRLHINMVCEDSLIYSIYSRKNIDNIISGLIYL